MKSLLLIGAALSASALGASTLPVADESGAVTGRVTFDGEVPKPLPPLKIGEKESEGCCPPGVDIDETDRSLLISKDGGIANVVVTLEADGFEVDVPEAPFVLDQKHCRFEPRVVVLPVGASIEYRNSDDVNHNIHTYSKKNKALNNNVAASGTEVQKLEKDETFQVKCDIHPWMLSNVVVTEATHWAVTDENGGYDLKGVPPGNYKLAYWHETLGKGKTEEVTVTAGGTAEHPFKVGKKKKKGRGRR
jgi:plastocyanin